MEYLKEIPIHHSSWEKLCFALISGALRDIILFVECPEKEILLQKTSSLSYKERRIKMKEYYKIKRISEKACEWIDGGGPKKGNNTPYISFQEACEGLKQDHQKVRMNIKNIIKKVMRKYD